MGDTIQQHLQNLDKILTRLQEHGTRLRCNKCRFLQPYVVFLGHYIDASGVPASHPKIKHNRMSDTSQRGSASVLLGDDTVSQSFHSQSVIATSCVEQSSAERKQMNVDTSM